jgi:hypothetical protein
VLARPGVGVGDAEADEAAAAVELLEPGGGKSKGTIRRVHFGGRGGGNWIKRWVPGRDGKAEIGVGGVEVGELVEAVAGEEDGADELVGHQAAQYLHPHGRPPQRSPEEEEEMLRLGERWRSFRLSRKIGDEGDLCRPIPLQLNGMEINFFCFSFFFFTLPTTVGPPKRSQTVPD